MKIVCTCGHSIEEHSNEIQDVWTGGCRYEEHGHYCQCEFTPDIIEARWWARYYKKKYENNCYTLYKWFSRAMEAEVTLGRIKEGNPWCGKCGVLLDQVRPGKWQCPNCE